VSDSNSLHRISQRLLALAGVLGLLLIAVVVNYWLHGGEETIDPFNPIAAAASQTQASSGYSGSTEIVYTVDGESSAPVNASGSFEYNAAESRARAVLTVPTPTGSVEVESVGDAHHVYVRSAAFAGQLPDGAEWIGIEPLTAQTSPGFAGSEGPADQLQMLRAVADVEALGSEAVNGTATKRYRGTIYLDRVADFFEHEGEAKLADEFRKLDKLAPDQMQVEVWIAAGGTLARMRMVSKLPTDDGRPDVTMDMRITIEELGVTPRIDLPDPGSVYDATPLLRQRLEGIAP
jgi:hypothetical protein